MSTGELCHKTRNRAFINPTGVSRQAIAAAVRICGTCPVKASCALTGLRAGMVLSGGGLPPSDVIFGGVVCRGDDATLEALAEVACAE